MVKVYIERTIKVPCKRAWELLSDFANIHHIHPMVKSVDIKSTNSNGLGAVRVCNFYDGNSIKEEIVEWNEEAKYFVIKLVEGSVPLKEFFAKISVKGIDDNKSKLMMDLDMHAKYGFLGKIMEHFIFKPKFGVAIGDLFAGVEEYNKTGIDVQEGFKAETPALVK